MSDSRQPARGSTRHHVKDCRRLVVSFDEETFAEMRRRALASDRPMSKVIRELVEWGLMAEDAA